MARQMSPRWLKWLTRLGRHWVPALLCALAAALSLMLVPYANISISFGATPSPQINNLCVSPRHGGDAPPPLPPTYTFRMIPPVAANGAVYMGYPIPDARTGEFYYGGGAFYYNHTIAAFRASDGAMLWSIPDTNNTASLILVDGKLILLGGNMVALRATDGTTLWQAPVNFSTFHQIPLAVRGGVLYASGGTSIYAIQLANGRMLWQRPAYENARLSAPLLDGNTLYVGATDGSMMALQADTGVIRWRVIVDPTYLTTYTPLAMLSGRLLVADPTGYLLVNPTNGENDEFAALPIESVPLFGVDVMSVDGRAYVGVETSTPDANVYSLLSSHSKLLWRASTGAWPAHLVAADANILCIGYLMFFAVRLSDGVVLWSQQLRKSYDLQRFAAASGYLFETIDGVNSPCNPKIDQSPELRALSSADGSVVWTDSFDPALELPPPCATCRAS